MKKTVKKDFFDRPALVVARDLLGKYVVRKVGGREVAAMITEVEAYFGLHDKASHARHGKTARNMPMWNEPGTIYVYFCYGVHWMLNVVVGKKGYPAAILIRGVEGASGPGRVTKFFSIDKKLNAAPLSKKSGLWIENRGVTLKAAEIIKTPRIGVAYAGSYVEKPWRFVINRRDAR